MAYGDLKHLNRTTTSDQILCDKEFNVAKYVKYDGYQRGLTFQQTFALIKTS